MENDFSKELDGVVRRKRIKELWDLADKYMDEWRNALDKEYDLKAEIQIMNDRLKAYQSIKEGLWTLYSQTDDELSKLTSGRKEELEQIKKEREEREDDLPF